jgi:hypothetical protein
VTTFYVINGTYECVAGTNTSVPISCTNPGDIPLNMGYSLNSQALTVVGSYPDVGEDLDPVNWYTDTNGWTLIVYNPTESAVTIDYSLICALYEPNALFQPSGYGD